MTKAKLDHYLRRRYQRLGAVFQLYVEARRHHRLADVILLKWLYPLTTLKQVEIICNEDGVPIAYVAWGFLTDTTMKRLSECSGTSIHISEWNDGRDLCVIDYAGDVSISSIIGWMLNSVSFDEFSQAYILRLRKADARPSWSSWSREYATRLASRLSYERSKNADSLD
jgi:hemolysin-activating ACP:hemolysin acyltransferase